jgi:predicted nucleic acid-binding Zn ribbon protein
MSRRRAPRSAANAFQAALQRAAPQTPLAAVQTAWSQAVGEYLARVAVPVSERDGIVTVECADAVSAQELDLMQETLLERLRGEVGNQAPQALKFRVNSERF